jgi:hypothetical protein
MATDRENPLLDLVDALTLPIREHHIQMHDYGVYLEPVYMKTHTTEHPPLLAQLAAAVNPSSNTAAGSASLKSNRNLIDSDALYRYALMTSAIGDWCRMWKVTPTRVPADDGNARAMADLRQWYIAYTRGCDDPQWYIKELGRWVSLIRNLVEPTMVRIPVRVRCPICQAITFTTEDGEQSTFPIVMEYRKPKDGESIRPTATCRNTDCGAVWEGYDAIAELGDEVAGRHADEEITTAV